MFPKPRAEGTALTLRHQGRTDVPPLITIESFDTSAGLVGLLQTPVRLVTVRVKDLAVRIPPGGVGIKNGDRDLPHVAHAERPSPILIDRIESRSARVEIQSRRPDRLPRVWDIQNLVMRDFGASAGSHFDAGLINPVPRGVIDTQRHVRPVACRRAGTHAGQRELHLSERRHERDQGARRDTVVRRHLSRRARADRGRGHDRDAGLLARPGRAAGAAQHEVQGDRRRHQRRHDSRARRSAAEQLHHRRDGIGRSRAGGEGPPHRARRHASTAHASKT